MDLQLRMHRDVQHLQQLNWHMEGEHRPMYVYIEDDIILGYYSLLLQRNEVCELNNVCAV